MNIFEIVWIIVRIPYYIIEEALNKNNKYDAMEYYSQAPYYENNFEYLVESRVAWMSLKEFKAIKKANKEGRWICGGNANVSKE